MVKVDENNDDKHMKPSIATYIVGGIGILVCLGLIIWIIITVTNKNKNKLKITKAL
jgi:hypothetical protein